MTVGAVLTIALASALSAAFVAWAELDDALTVVLIGVAVAVALAAL